MSPVSLQRLVGTRTEGDSGQVRVVAPSIVVSYGKRLVRLFRFDEEVSIPISHLGSRLKTGPLTGDDSRVRVEVMHLPPDGRIGRHVATVQQLFAVVAGSGWVSGQDGERRDIRPGYAALWDAGEDHEARSEGGLTAICVEGHFEMWAMSVTREIVVSDYDADWPNWFETVCQRVWPVVEDVALRIDHIGSPRYPVSLRSRPLTWTSWSRLKAMSAP